MFDYITLCMMIINIINSCIIVIHPVINRGDEFMNIYHEFKIIYIYEEIIVGSWRVKIVIPSSSPILFDILLFWFIVSQFLISNPMPETQKKYLNGRNWCSMSKI